MQEGKKGNQKLVKASTIAVIHQCLIDLILNPLIEEVGTVLMLLHRSISIENPFPPVDRIVPWQVNLSCIDDAEYQPIYQAVGLEDIAAVHRSYRCVPAGRLAV